MSLPSGGTTSIAFTTPLPLPIIVAATTSDIGSSIAVGPWDGGSIRANIQSRYWTDARLVEAHGTLAVYDVASSEPATGPAAIQQQWPTVLEKSEKPWTPTDRLADWVALMGNTAMDSPGNAVTVACDRQIGHRLTLRSAGEMCRVQLDLRSKESTYPLAEIVWYDAGGTVLDRVMGAGKGKADYHLSLYSRVPAGAKTGWVCVRTWQGTPAELKQGSITTWPLDGPTGIASRNRQRTTF